MASPYLNVVALRCLCTSNATRQAHGYLGMFPYVRTRPGGMLRHQGSSARPLRNQPPPARQPAHDPGGAIAAEVFLSAPAHESPVTLDAGGPDAHAARPVLDQRAGCATRLFAGNELPQS